MGRRQLQSNRPGGPFGDGRTLDCHYHFAGLPRPGLGRSRRADYLADPIVPGMLRDNGVTPIGERRTGVPKRIVRRSFLIGCRDAARALNSTPAPGRPVFDAFQTPSPTLSPTPLRPLGEGKQFRLSINSLRRSGPRLGIQSEGRFRSGDDE